MAEAIHSIDHLLEQMVALKASDLHGADVQKLTDAELKQVISNGKNNMPAFAGQVTAAEIDDLVKYVRTFAKAKN